MFLVRSCPIKMKAQIALLSHSFISEVERSTHLVIEAWLPSVALNSIIAVCLVRLNAVITRRGEAVGGRGGGAPPPLKARR